MGWLSNLHRWLIDRYLREADEADGDATTPERWEEAGTQVGLGLLFTLW
jgi:hypothetical protein